MDCFESINPVYPIKTFINNYYKEQYYCSRTNRLELNVSDRKSRDSYIIIKYNRIVHVRIKQNEGVKSFRHKRVYQMLFELGEKKNNNNLQH